MIGVGGLGHLGRAGPHGADRRARSSPSTGRDSARGWPSDLRRRPRPRRRGRRPPPRSARPPAGAAPTWCSTSSAPTRPSPRRPPACRQLGDITIVGIAGGTLPVSFFGVALRGERADDLLGQPGRAGGGARPGRPRAAARGDHRLRARGGDRGLRPAGDGRVEGRAVVVPHQETGHEHPALPHWWSTSPCSATPPPSPRPSLRA